MENEFEEIDIREILHILLMRWWIIVICFLVAAISSAVVSFYFLTPVYQAQTSLFLGKESEKLAGIDIGDLQLSNQLINDYREIIKSRLVSAEVLESLNIDMAIEEFQRRVNVTTIKDSRLFKISFESTDPELATRVANQLGEEIKKKAKEIIDVKNVQVIDVAEVPNHPIKPNKKMNVAVASVLGIMLGVFIIFVLEFLDHTIKRPQDIEKYLGINTIGEIPKFEGERRNIKHARRKSK